MSQSFAWTGNWGKVVGWIDTDSPHPVNLQLKAMCFSQLSWKHHYNEVFVRTGRKLKPDLILGS